MIVEIMIGRLLRSLLLEMDLCLLDLMLLAIKIWSGHQHVK